MKDQLDPEARALLDEAARLGVQDIVDLPVEVARQQMREGRAAVAGPLLPVHAVIERTVPGPAGAIPVRIFRPSANTDLPVLVYFHGGGWVQGDLDTHDNITRALCQYGDCVVVSVDYRLAPEHRFPAAFDDAYTATCWVAANATELGIDPTRLAVGGDSAGGNLAAAVAQRGRDDSALAIAFQLLIYPVTDLSLGFPSMQEFADGYRLTRAAMACFIEHYLGPQGNRNDPRAAPLLAPDLTGLPPALVLTAGCDPLRDEGKAYADKLAQAGVTVEYRCFDGMIHGFVGMPGALKQATIAQREAAAALQRALCG